MKIFVTVKQVPDTSGKVAVKADGTLDRTSMKSITNLDDLNAVEAALRLKEQIGCKVIVVTMGPPAASGMLRELMAMGADESILITDRLFGGSDTFATSQIIAAAIDHYGLDDEDAVFCGKQAIDGDTAQVGPQIAEKLHIPQITYAVRIEYSNHEFVVSRQTDDGFMRVKTKTPCLITCIRELNTPRYMSVWGIEKCFEKPLSVYTYETLKNHPLIETDTIGLKGSPTNIYKSFTPPKKKDCVLLQGNETITVPELFGHLKTRHIL